MSNMSMTKYGKDKNDGLWLIKWMRWTMVDEMNGEGLWFVKTTKMDWC